ncbi:MAG: response regulator transcription factor [Clostridiales Family XIII bacterium]|jgi:DNA-binding NarL/FixJ family response regulator|nr:response regulator transcription factor [Clostridiales Family XIII bacterium]
MDKIRIVLADDDAIILQGLSMVLSGKDSFEVVGTAKDGSEAVAVCRRERPDVAVLDIRMPVMNGIEAAAALLADDLAAPLLLTTFDEPELIAKALEVGARGYILKNSPPERIFAAIETVAQGGTVFAPDVIDFIREMALAGASRHGGGAGAGADGDGGDVFADLTPRELEIAALVAEGLSNTQIAERLFLADGTVRNHISTILEKTGLEHRTQIAVKYFQRG